MSVIKSIIKMFNGEEWNEYHPKTDAEQVLYDDNGTETTVQEELTKVSGKVPYRFEIKEAQIKVSSDSTEVSIPVYFSGKIKHAFATSQWKSGQAYGYVKNVSVRIGHYTDQSRMDLIVSGKFVAGHFLRFQVIAFIEE